MTFTLTAEPPEGASKAALKNAHFDMPVSGAAVQLLELAATGKSVPKASFASVDGEGKARYRVDLEGVTVSTVGLQTLGNREAASGDLEFQRVRVTYGEGKDAVVTGWDKVKNAPWK
jgi:type VI protein secretion system component Hcp